MLAYPDIALLTHGVTAPVAADGLAAFIHQAKQTVSHERGAEFVPDLRHLSAVLPTLRADSDR